MAASPSFLQSCQAAIVLLPQYAAFQAACAALSAAGEAGRAAAWQACYGDGQIGLSPAHGLRRAIRDVIVNEQYALAVTLSQADAEAAYQQLAALLAPDAAQPEPGPQARSAVMTQEDLDLIRTAAARLASD
jgi:hypothetical protein